MRYLFLLGWLGVVSPALAQHLRLYSPAQADTILGELRAAIVDYHPAIALGDHLARVEAAREDIREVLALRSLGDSLTMAAVIAMAAPFRDVLGDGHFQFRPTQTKAFRAARDSSQYALPLARDNRGVLYVADTVLLRDATVLPKGVPVTHLDGREVQALIAEVSAVGGVDDHARQYAREFHAAHNLPEFYQRVYGYRDSLTLTYIEGGDTLSHFLYPEAKPSEEDPPGLVRRIATRRKRKRQRLAKLIYLDTTDAPGVYHLTVRSFSTGVIGSGGGYQRLRKLFKQLDEAEADGLIIDLRNNLGGAASLVDHLYGFLAEGRYTMLDSMTATNKRALGRRRLGRFGRRVFGVRRTEAGHYRKRWAGKPTKPKRRHHFDGDVVVLTNESTFSGGTALAHYVKHYGRGRVVGQVPGGSAERMYAGSSMRIKVGPDKEFQITMPLWYMDMVGDEKGNVQPDLIVERTPDIILDEDDDTLQAALDLLQSE